MKKYYNKIRSYLNKKNPLELFLFKGAALFVLWYIAKTILNKTILFKDHYHDFKMLITKTVLYSSQFLIKIFGYESIIYGKVLYIENAYAVKVNRECLSLSLIAMFAGFLMIYPGKIKSKYWFIPLGIIIIFILNILRVSGLSMIRVCSPEDLDFYHRYVFKIIIYCIVFLMWYVWIKKYSIIKTKT